MPTFTTFTKATFVLGIFFSTLAYLWLFFFVLQISFPELHLLASLFSPNATNYFFLGSDSIWHHCYNVRITEKTVFSEEMSTLYYLCTFYWLFVLAYWSHLGRIQIHPFPFLYIALVSSWWVYLLARNFFGVITSYTYTWNTSSVELLWSLRCERICSVATNTSLVSSQLSTPLKCEDLAHLPSLLVISIETLMLLASSLILRWTWVQIHTQE